jgi:thymidylate kinase
MPMKDITISLCREEVHASRLQAWIRPRGVFLVVLGPDGAGKSSLIKQLIETTQTSFPGHQLFHWRPGCLWRRKGTGGSADPHGKNPHPAWWSVARVFSHILDYWVGYVSKIRPALVQSNVVVFDRYFYDLLVDPRRYRYGGPQRLLSTLALFVPRHDLILVLDASEEIVLSRKQELGREELRRQRRGYRRLAQTLPQAELLSADQELTQVVSDARRAVARFVALRAHVSR